MSNNNDVNNKKYDDNDYKQTIYCNNLINEFQILEITYTGDFRESIELLDDTNLSF